MSRENLRYSTPSSSRNDERNNETLKAGNDTMPRESYDEHLLADAYENEEEDRFQDYYGIVDNS